MKRCLLSVGLAALSNRTSYIAKRYKTVRLAYFYGKEGETLTNHGGRITADSDNILKPDTDFCAKCFLNSDFSYCFFFEPMI